MAYEEDYGFDKNGHITFEHRGNFYVGNARERTYGIAATPMAFDIAAIQSLYGANMSYHTGNGCLCAARRKCGRRRDVALHLGCGRNRRATL
jgi:hypothetical protein